jgi:hypothetical protein
VWFQMDMTIERAIYEKRVAHMREALGLLEQATAVEVMLADVLEEIATGSMERVDSVHG